MIKEHKATAEEGTSSGMDTLLRRIWNINKGDLLNKEVFNKVKLVVDGKEEGELIYNNNNTAAPVAMESGRNKVERNNNTSNISNTNKISRKSKSEVLVEEILGAVSKYMTSYKNLVMRK